MADHYSTLGVNRAASRDEIKRAYRRLARELHPDANRDDPETEERFKEITRAYEVLSDPHKRQRYDVFGEERPGGGSASDLGGISDLFSAFFGGAGQTRRGRGGPARGSDILAEIELTLEEAAWGVEREVEVTALGECDVCEGSGARPGTFPSRCSECGGTGEIREVRRSLLGNVMTAAACLRCGGTGREIADPCDRCGGGGRVEVSNAITVRIPSGVDEGAQLRVSGRGEAGTRGGSTGDLYVSIRIAPHETFRRAGDDLGCQVSVPMTIAALGGKVEVPTLEGSEEIQVAPGTQAGEIKRLRGQGMPRLDGRGRGELVALLEVVTPTDLDERQTELMAELARLRGEVVGRQDLIGKIREAFK